MTKREAKRLAVRWVADLLLYSDLHSHFCVYQDEDGNLRDGDDINKLTAAFEELRVEMHSRSAKAPPLKFEVPCL